ncbi:MAG: DUF308 domain-containing protein [Paracoccaceae bacterium]|nr:DUF308 domain-containing protein [Maritimibacter sp.]
MITSGIHLREGPPRAVNALRWIGWSFVALGAASVLAPQLATFVATSFVAAAMVFWGALGLWMSFTLRAFPERNFSAVAFGLLASLGIVFLALPTLGIEVLTMLVVAGFLAEGIVSIAYGLRVSARLRGWRWMVASGIAALVIGLIVLYGWPDTATWLLGLLLGINFLSTGIALLALGRAPSRIA